MVTAVARSAPPAVGKANVIAVGKANAKAVGNADGKAVPGWRLTRRGRVVVAALVVILVMAVAAAASIAAGGRTAQATSHALSRNAVERNLVRITVRPGQSLWSVAEAADPHADTRVVIQQIIELNALAGMTLNPGEQLWVPRG